MLIIGIEAMCEDFGCDMIGPATRLAEALVMARTAAFDAAVLDVNLDGEMSWDVAMLLKERGIPFAFTTGYDGASILPSQFVGARILHKPYRIAEIERCIRQMIGQTD